MPCLGLINGLASDQSFFGGEEGENDAPTFSSSLDCMGGLNPLLAFAKTEHSAKPNTHAIGLIII